MSIADSPSRKRFRSFAEFYPYYLDQHSDRWCRLLHVTGVLLAVATVITAIVMREWLLLALIPVIGYGLSWIGHLFFEHNKPATFGSPLYSLAGDVLMTWHILTGQYARKAGAAPKPMVREVEPTAGP